MSLMQPYQNETEVVLLDNLNIENRTTHISIYGDVSLTRDKAGLENARVLRDILVDAVKVLESDPNLPDHVEFKSTATVENPFK